MEPQKNPKNEPIIFKVQKRYNLHIKKFYKQIVLFIFVKLDSIIYMVQPYLGFFDSGNGSHRQT